MRKMVLATVPDGPHIRIDALNCKQVKSSLEKAPAKVKYGKGGRKIISKEKKSEKLPPERLPMESTNPSDAVKYLLCRTKWMQLTRKKKNSAFIGVGTN